MMDASTRTSMTLARFSKELDLMFCDLRRAVAASSIDYLDKVSRVYGETDGARETRSLFEETLISPMAPLPEFVETAPESRVLPSDEPAAHVAMGVAGIPNSAPTEHAEPVPAC